MFVVSKKNIILPGPNGESFRLAKDYMGPVPAWAEDSAYLRALAADGKVILSASGADKDFEKEKGKKRKPKEEDPPKKPEGEDPPEKPDDVDE